jgi:hypothetical protein
VINNHELFGPFGPKRFESRKLLDQANGQSCVHCGMQDATVVGAHYHGDFAHLFSRAAGEKCDDFMVAHLCHACHLLFDAMPLEQTIWDSPCDRERAFLVCVGRTLRRLFFQGCIVVT